MKTLEEIESLVKSYGNACYTSGGSTYGSEEPSDRFTQQADKKEVALLASLAQWDAIIQECLPELKQEVKSLEWMQNTHNEEDLSEDVGLSPKNAARLAHLRGLLGEGWEE